MRKLVIAATVMLVVTLATFQQATADFGGLLEKLSVFNAPDQEDSPDLPHTTDPNAENGEPTLAGPESGQLTAPGVERVDEPLQAPAPEAQSRSPIPPPHVPDDSAGFRSEESMIESDAERAIETHSASPLPPSVDLEELFQSAPLRSPSPTSQAPNDQHASACSCSDCNSHSDHHHGHACGRLASLHAMPAPYIYTGPGLPPPVSLESFSRTPECYRGLWDGYAEEKQRRCAKSHAHLHGYCDCHRVAVPSAHRPGGAPFSQQRGTCAKGDVPAVRR